MAAGPGASIPGAQFRKGQKVLALLEDGRQVPALVMAVAPGPVYSVRAEGQLKKGLPEASLRPMEHTQGLSAALPSTLGVEATEPEPQAEQMVIYNLVDLEGEGVCVCVCVCVGIILVRIAC